MGVSLLHPFLSLIRHKRPSRLDRLDSFWPNNSFFFFLNLFFKASNLPVILLQGVGSTKIHLLSAAALVRVMLWHSGNCGDGFAPSLSEVGPLSDVMANATG